MDAGRNPEKSVARPLKLGVRARESLLAIRFNMELRAERLRRPTWACSVRSDIRAREGRRGPWKTRN